MIIANQQNILSVVRQLLHNTPKETIGILIMTIAAKMTMTLTIIIQLMYNYVIVSSTPNRITLAPMNINKID